MIGLTDDEYGLNEKGGFELTPPVDGYEHTPEYYDRMRNVDPDRINFTDGTVSVNLDDKVSPAHYWKYNEDLTLNEVKESCQELTNHYLLRTRRHKLLI